MVLDIKTYSVLFYGCDVSDVQDFRMAERIMMFPEIVSGANCHGTGLGKPSVPKTEENDLSTFINEDGHMFFRILKLGSQFLSIQFELWKTDVRYQEGRRVISNLCVGNDAPVRGVKLFPGFFPAVKKRASFKTTCRW